MLVLMFVGCHGALPRGPGGADLRVVGGLSSEEIARAFLVPVLPRTAHTGPSPPGRGTLRLVGACSGPTRGSSSGFTLIEW